MSLRLDLIEMEMKAIEMEMVKIAEEQEKLRYDINLLTAWIRNNELIKELSKR